MKTLAISTLMIFFFVQSTLKVTALGEMSGPRWSDHAYQGGRIKGTLTSDPDSQIKGYMGAITFFFQLGGT